MKRGIIAVDPQKSLVVGCTVYAWGAPACLSISAVLTDILTDQPMTYGMEDNPTLVCWISPGKALFFSFGLLIVLFVSVNIVCFSVTVVVLLKAKKLAAVEVTNSASNANDVFVSVKISSIMEFNWLFGGKAERLPVV